MEDLGAGGMEGLGAGRMEEWEQEGWRMWKQEGWKTWEQEGWRTLALGSVQEHLRLPLQQRAHSAAPLAPFRSHLKKPFSGDFNAPSSKPTPASSEDPHCHPILPLFQGSSEGLGALAAEPAQHLPAHAPALSLGQNMDAVFIFDLCQAEKEILFLQLLISEV